MSYSQMITKGFVLSVIYLFLSLTQVHAVDSNQLWEIFDQNLTALKDKNVSAYNETSFVQVQPSQEESFKQMADFMYGSISTVDKIKYNNILKDEKQAILTTQAEKVDTNEEFGYKQGSVFFVNDEGKWKILLNTPERKWMVLKATTDQTPEQIDQELQEMKVDSDQDGLTDSEENCNLAQKFNPSCVKSDPNNKDTNGNGWWDGIEAKMADL